MDLPVDMNEVGHSHLNAVDSAMDHGSAREQPASQYPSALAAIFMNHGGRNCDAAPKKNGIFLDDDAPFSPVPGSSREVLDGIGAPPHVLRTMFTDG